MECTPVDLDAMQTKTAFSEIKFNPIDELHDIPVNIINRGKDDYKYLSTASEGNLIDLYTHDDGSLRQRWYVDRYYIILTGGHHLSQPGTTLFIQPEATNSESRPFLSAMWGDYPFGVGTRFIPISDTPYYLIQVAQALRSGQSLSQKYYLQGSSNAGELRFSSGTSDFAKWEVRPLGEFKIIDISYIQTTSDVFTRNDQRIDRAIIDNQKNESINYHFSINGSYNESSSFSTAEGVSVSVTTSLKVGIPIIKEIAGEISISTTQTSSKDWTYGQSESKSRTIQHSIDIPVPAHTRTIAEAYMSSYTSSVTYIVTLQNTLNGKTFRAKGRWDGILTSEFYCNVRDEASNQIIATYKIPNK